MERRGSHIQSLSKRLLNSQTAAELRNTLSSLEKMATKANEEIL
jgi:hypothetical protein